MNIDWASLGLVSIVTVATTVLIVSGSGGASMLAVALAYVAVFFAVGAVAARSPKQPGPCLSSPAAKPSVKV